MLLGFLWFAAEDPNADFFITPTSFDILGPDAREPFELTIFVRIDGVALETDEEVILTLQGLNTAGSAIIDPALPGQFVNPVIHVVIEDVESKWKEMFVSIARLLYSV